MSVSGSGVFVAVFCLGFLVCFFSPCSPSTLCSLLWCFQPSQLTPISSAKCFGELDPFCTHLILLNFHGLLNIWNCSPVSDSATVGPHLLHTTEWSHKSAICYSLSEFLQMLTPIFQSTTLGREAARALVSIRQGKWSDLIFIVKWCIIVGDSSWNHQGRFLNGFSETLKEHFAGWLDDWLHWMYQQILRQWIIWLQR